MRIRFTSDYAVKDATGTSYTAGDVLDCSDASANHFIRKGVAVEESVHRRRQATVKPPHKAVVERGEPTTVTDVPKGDAG